MHSNIQALDKQKHHKVAINPAINNAKKWPYFKMLWCKHREIFKERLVIFATLCMKWLTHFTSISRSFFFFCLREGCIVSKMIPILHTKMGKKLGKIPVGTGHDQNKICLILKVIISRMKKLQYWKLGNVIAKVTRLLRLQHPVDTRHKLNFTLVLLSLEYILYIVVQMKTLWYQLSQQCCEKLLSVPFILH